MEEVVDFQNKKRSPAAVSLEILRKFREKGWMNRSMLSMEVKYDLNRLSKIISDFEEMELVERWEKLPQERKNRIKETQVNIGDDMYNISQRGITKLETLEKDCIDDLERILRVKTR